MALDTSFIGAFRPPSRHRVLGVELRPFCLWHVFLLSAEDSPFLRQTAPLSADLQIAVGICRLAFPETRIVRPGLPWLFRRAVFPVQTRRFMQYAGDYLHRPEFKVDLPGTPPKVRGHPPEVLAHFADLFGWGTWPGGEAEVWNLPLGRAHYYRAMAIRAQGLPLHFKTDHERKFEADLRAHEEAKAAARAGEKGTPAP